MRHLAFKQTRLASMPLLALGPWAALQGLPPPVLVPCWALTLATAGAWCQWVVRALLRDAGGPDAQGRRQRGRGGA